MYALYDQSRVVVGGLLIAFIVEQAVMATSLAITVPRVMFTDICVSLSVPPAAVWFGYVPVYPLYSLLYDQLTTVTFSLVPVQRRSNRIRINVAHPHARSLGIACACARLAPCTAAPPARARRPLGLPPRPRFARVVFPSLHPLTLVIVVQLASSSTPCSTSLSPGPRTRPPGRAHRTPFDAEGGNTDGCP